MWIKFEEQALSEGKKSPRFHGNQYGKSPSYLKTGWKCLLQQDTKWQNRGKPKKTMQILVEYRL